MGPANLIDGRWQPLDAERADVTSVNPARPEEIVWSARASTDAVEAAIIAARRALPAWRMAGAEARASALKRFAAVVTARAEDIARAITSEMGKTMAESRLEAKLLADKVTITLGETCQSRVRPWEFAVAPTRVGRCSFRSHGVMAVLGPFNFPAHLPNGHWVPALLLGNTIVFKPSERTRLVGQIMAECMHAAELPPGVFNLVQGGPAVAKALVAHEGLDGILFTGSWPVGRSIMQAKRLLQDLCDPRLTPRVAAGIRDRARGALRHYPSDWDMNRAAESAPHVFQERMEDLHRFVAAGSRAAAAAQEEEDHK